MVHIYRKKVQVTLPQKLQMLTKTQKEVCIDDPSVSLKYFLTSLNPIPLNVISFNNSKSVSKTVSIIKKYAKFSLCNK